MCIVWKPTAKWLHPIGLIFMTFGNRISRTFLWSLMCVSLFMPGAFSHSHACESGTATTQPNLFQEERSGLSQVIESLRQSTARERTFHETYYSGMLTTPSHKEGTLVFHPPSRLEKHVQSPAKESFIAEGDTLHYENPSREISQTFALQDYPALAALIEGLRSLFNGDEQHYANFSMFRWPGHPINGRYSFLPKHTMKMTA